jgi:cobalamin biosynthesis Mg chelatase CobN
MLIIKLFRSKKYNCYYKFVKKLEAIELLVSEGWTKADADRALKVVDFTTHPDELTIRKSVSLFAGAELLHRQRLQAAQRTLVTKKTREIERIKEEYTATIEQIKPQSGKDNNTDIRDLLAKNKSLEATIKNLSLVNEHLKKDNKDMKNIVDAIKLQLTIEMRKLLRYPDNEIRQAAMKFFKSILG